MNSTYTNSTKFANDKLNTILLRIRKYTRVYYSLTILISLMASFSSVMTSIMISKMVWNKDGNGNVDWFYVMTTFISAITTFIVSTLNFFMIKDKIDSAKKLWHKVEAEIVKHDLHVGIYANRENADYNLFIIVSQLTDNVAAKKEVVVNG